MSQTVVCALYKFVRLDSFEDLRQPLLTCMLDHQVRGTLLLASEGINGTIAGSREGVDAVLEWLRQDPRFAEFDYKESFSETMPFKRTKVKLKKEIVTMGIQGVDPNQAVGTYCTPEEWNELISDPDTVLIDTRNDYEYQVGTFRNATNPNTTTFREFPEYVKENLEQHKGKKIAMFCTGGIRCEKSTAYLKEQGYDDVYHLKGGILKYLEEMPQDNTLWDGECFVFDERVTVDHDLQPGSYEQCNACRMPITEEEMQSKHFEQGVSCPHCYDKYSAEQKARFAEREKQMNLAKARGEVHIGGDVAERIELNRQAKIQAKQAQQAADRERQSKQDKKTA